MFKLAKYDIEGHFLGFETLTNQLVICDKSQSEIDRLLDIGTTVNIGCSFDLSKLLSPIAEDLPKTTNIFYDLFLEDFNGDLIDVPILIDNLKNGDNPNQNQ